MAISKITGSALGKDVIMKDVATADGSSPTLTLQTGDTNIEANDVLGTINFQAPDEGAGTDAILVAAGISAISEGDFSSSNNETSLVFKTGASAAADEKMRINSAGRVGLSTTAPLHILDIEADTTGSIPTDHAMSTSTDNDNYFGFHNVNNSATFSGLSLETRTSGAARWLIANEWKDTYLGDLAFRTRDGGSSSSEVLRIANNGDLTITSTAAASTTAGPVLLLQRDGASPEDNDVMGQIVFKMDDDAGNMSTFARIETVATDVSNGGEDGTLKFIVADDDTFVTALSLDGADAGTATFNHDAKFADNGKAIFGAGSDLQIFHDGSNSYVSDQGTGQLVLLTNSFRLNNAANGENIITAEENGAVSLFNNDISTFVTSATGATLVSTGANGGLTIDTDGTSNGSQAAVRFFYNGTQGGNQCGLRWFDKRDQENARIVNSLQNDGSGAADANLLFVTATGSSLTTHFSIDGDGTLLGTDTSIGSISDRRLKKDITDYTYNWDTFKTYAPKQFNWKEPQKHGNKTNQIGFIAQDLQNVDTQWVGETKKLISDRFNDVVDPDAQYLGTPDEEGTVTSLTAKLGEKDAMYISIIQQLIAEVETLKSKVQALEDA